MAWKDKVVDKFFDQAKGKYTGKKAKTDADPYYPYEKKKLNQEPPRIINRYEYTLEDEKYFSGQEPSRYRPNYHQPQLQPKAPYQNNQIKTRVYDPNEYYENDPITAYNPGNYGSNTYLMNHQGQSQLLDITNQNYQDATRSQYQNNHEQYQEPNIAYHSLNLKSIPREIANEVRSEKYRLAFTMIVGFLGIIAVTLPLILWFLKQREIVTDQEGLIPHPALMIPLLILASGLFFVALFDWIKIRREVEVFLRKSRMGNQTIPNFIIANYKKMHVRSIIINWIAFPSYLLGALGIAILYGLSNKVKPKLFGFIILDIAIKDLTSEIIILTSLVFAIFFLQVLNIIFVRKRKANIIGYYGYEIVNPYEMIELKKTINRRCLYTWLVILGITFLFIAIPWLIIRRRKVRSTS